MFRTRTLSCALAVSLAAGSALAQSVREDFEAYPAGGLPGGEWFDAADRVEGHETLPTALLIETTDARGEPTLAVQTLREFGSSQGILMAVEPAPVQTLSADVRVDAYGNGMSWPMAVGFNRNDGAPDINQSPHAVVYTWIDRRWHLFVSLGVGMQSQDMFISTPPIVDGQWYRVTLSVDHEDRYFEVLIQDAQTNAPIGGRGFTLPWWTESFDTVALFDGDVSGSIGTQASVDNVAYEAQNSICPGDCNFSESVDFDDLVNMLGRFGARLPSPCDADGSGLIDFGDLVTALFAFGVCE